MELHYTARATIHPIFFNKIIKDLNHACDTVKIKLKKTSLIFEGYLDDEVVIIQSLNKNSFRNDTTITNNERNDTMATQLDIMFDVDDGIIQLEKKLPIKCLMTLNKCVNLGTEVSIYFSSANPLLIEYPLNGLGTFRLAFTD